MLLQQPVLALVASLGVIAVALSARSTAYPVVLAGLPHLYIGLTGTNPFPNKSIAFGTFAWTALAILIAVLRDPDALPLRVLLAPSLLLTVVLAVLMVVRLSGSPAEAYGSQKTQFFIAQNVIFVFAGVLIARRRRDFVLWAALALGISSASALVLAKGLASGTAVTYSGRFTFAADYSTIQFGRETAIGLLLATWVLLTVGVVWRRVLAVAVMPMLAVAFFASGSRGPVVGLAAGAAVLLGLVLRTASSRRRVLLLLVGVALAAFFVPQLVPGQNLSRSVSFIFGGDSGDTSNGRYALWSLAWDTFRAHPVFGAGTGAFADFAPAEFYPHNLVLELLAEVGIIGAALGLAIVVAAARSIARVWRLGLDADRSHAALIAGLLAATFANAMFSGDVPANSQLWLVAGLAVGLAQRVTVPLELAERAVWMRRRRADQPLRAARPVRRQRTEPARQVPSGPPPGVIRSAGAILTPADGTTVSGIVTVAAEPASTGWGVGLVQIEVSGPSGEWRPIGAVQDAAFDVFGVREGARQHIAVLRSQRLAELVVMELEQAATPFERFEVASSQRRPWQTSGSASIDWDTRELPQGGYRLRVVTTDIAGLRVTSPEIALAVAAEVEPAGEARPAEPPRAAKQGRAAAAQAAEREQALQARERAVVAELEERGRELEERLAGLAEREQALAREASALEERDARVAQRLAELAAREQSVVFGETDLAGRARALEERERVVSAVAREALEREQALQAAAAGVEERARSLDARLAAAEKREHALRVSEAQAEEGAQALRAATAELEERARALDARQAAAEEREQALRVAEAQADEGARALGEHEQALQSAAAEAQQRARALEEREQALQASEAEAAERAQALHAAAEDAQQRVRALEERERALRASEAEAAERAEALRTAEAAAEAGAQALGEHEQALQAAAAEAQQRARALEDRKQALQVSEEEAAERARALQVAAAEAQQRARALEDREQALQAAETQAVEHAEALQAAGAEAQQRGRLLDERLAAVDDREQALQSAAAEAAERARSLDERLAAVQEREHALQAAEAQSAEGGRSLDERLAVVVEREQAVARADAEAREANRALEERLAAIAIAEAEVEERRRGLEQRVAELADRERSISAATVELEEHAGELEERLAEIDDRERAAARAAAAAVEGSRELEQRVAALAAREQALAQAESAAKERSGTLAERLAELAAREEAVASAEAEVEERNRGLEERVAALTRRERALVRHVASQRTVAEAPVAAPAPVEPPPVVAPAEPPVAAEPAQPSPAAQPVVAPPAEPVPPRPQAPVEPPPPVPVSRGRGEIQLWQLERLFAENPNDDAFVQTEREALLFYLRDYAELDGRIPASFHGVVYEAFGDLLSASAR